MHPRVLSYQDLSGFEEEEGNDPEEDLQNFLGVDENGDVSMKHSIYELCEKLQHDENAGPSSIKLPAEAEDPLGNVEKPPPQKKSHRLRLAEKKFVQSYTSGEGARPRNLTELNVYTFTGLFGKPSSTERRCKTWVQETLANVVDE